MEKEALICKGDAMLYRWGSFIETLVYEFAFTAVASPIHYLLVLIVHLWTSQFFLVSRASVVNQDCPSRSGDSWRTIDYNIFEV